MEERPRLRTYDWRVSGKKGAARASAALAVASTVAGLGGLLADLEREHVVWFVLPAVLVYGLVEALRNAAKQHR